MKLMGPLASLIMASSSSFFTFSWPEQSRHRVQAPGLRRGQMLPPFPPSPMEASTSLRSSLLMMPSLFWSMMVKACVKESVIYRVCVCVCGLQGPPGLSLQGNYH